MTRASILLVLLALGVAACGTEQSTQTGAASTPTVAATASPTAEPTAEPTEEPDATADTGDETALADLIPDELNGVARTVIPGMDQFIASALQAQGLDAEDAEFVFASYGEDENAVILTAFRIPDVDQPQLELLARLMSGAEGTEGVDAEQIDVNGKSVLRMTAEGAAGGQEGVVYMYFAEGAAFTIISPSTDTAAAEQLLAELP